MPGTKSFGFSLSEEETIWLERIIIDEDESEALVFLKKIIHRKLVGQRANKLQSHLDAPNPTAAFAAKVKRADSSGGSTGPRF